MPSSELLIAFAVATLIFAFMPGPAMLYTAAQTVARGRKGGFMAAFGIHCGGYAHVLGAMLGLSALFQHIPTLYTAVKFAGAIYLVWLGIAMIRANSDPEAMPKIAVRSPYRAFADSVVVEVLNPKAALFFLAFLPQFVEVDAGAPLWLQFLVLGTLVNVTFSLADILTVLLASAALARLRRSHAAQHVLRWTGGSVLVGLGAHMAASRT
ncbi:MAG TPA: LysE family translocator [Alphaproteobacteria bacterium]|nr:LysE family translocator [Alphaproteobacteria bacterium]